jgi:urease accessory protein UreH
MLHKRLFGLLSFTLALMALLVLQGGIGYAAPVVQTADDTGAEGADAEEAGEVYIVQPGDSLYEISGRFYDEPDAWPEIVEATNAKAAEDSSFATIRDPRRLSVGQKLWIPRRGTAPTATPPPTPTATRQPPTRTPAPTRTTVTPTTVARTPAPTMIPTTVPTTTVAMTSSVTPQVRISQPLNGATVPPTFTVAMSATGLIVEPAGAIRPGAGHMHILVDTDFVPAGEVIIFDEQHLHFGQGQLTTTLALEPGVHTLRLQFANGAHIAQAGEQYQDTITVTVRGEDTGPSVQFVAPLNGATVAPTFTVEMAATDLVVEPAGDIHPNAGHMHILVDTDFVPAGEVIIFDEQHLHFGQGQLTTTLALEPGVHTLRLQFANGAHIAQAGEQYQDTITVTVRGEDTGPGVRFVAPQNGATVAPTFTVEMAATGLTVEPAGAIRSNAGHMHILIDTDFVPAGEVIIADAQHLHFGQGQLTTTLALEPGVHTLRLQFANGAHIALEGDQYQDTITVTVASEAAASGVRFVEPVTGATVPPTFTVAMAAMGLTVEPAGAVRPGAGHMHILVDTDFVPAGEVIIFDEQHLHFGQGQLTTTLTLEPGVHTLGLQFANGAHLALDGEQYQDTITVTVAAE